MNSIETILNTYKEAQTITETQKITGYSWQKIAKTLSSEGIIVNDSQALILELHEKGMTPEEISKMVGYNEKTIMAYLPRVRPVYNENPSINALRIKKCRSKKGKQDTE